MSNEVITDAEAREFEAKLAVYKAAKEAEAREKRDQLYWRLKPIVESAEYADLHGQLKAARDGFAGDEYFGIHLNSFVDFTMPSLVQAVEAYNPTLVPDTMPLPPLPAPEEDGDAQ